MAARREPIDRIVDLAIAVPTSTLVAARRAVPLAARLGALGTARLVERVSTAVHELRSADAPHERTDVADAVERREPAANRPSEPSAPEPASSVGADELPIAGYDDLAARQVVDRLGTLDRADLARIEIYEREHRNRSTVLGKISQLTS